MFQKLRKATIQRDFASFPDAYISELSGQLVFLEQRMAKGIGIHLREHILWPWLSQFPGLGGVYLAVVLSLIRDPNRFPERTPKDPRKINATGARAIWRYFGFHVGADG